MGIVQAHQFEGGKIRAIWEHYFPSDLGISQNADKYMFLEEPKWDEKQCTPTALIFAPSKMVYACTIPKDDIFL